MYEIRQGVFSADKVGAMKFERASILVAKSKAARKTVSVPIATNYIDVIVKANNKMVFQTLKNVINIA